MQVQLSKKTLSLRAKKLSSMQTKAELRLWYYLRGRRLYNMKFRRQTTIDNYIVDFVCIEKMIIIEVDGGQHDEQKNYDARRTRFLESLGFTVLRFWNNEVLGNTGVVLNEILRACGFEVD